MLKALIKGLVRDTVTHERFKFQKKRGQEASSNKEDTVEHRNSKLGPSKTKKC